MRWEEAAMLELYHNNISVCAQKVRHALAEKEIEWTGRHVSLLAGEQISPDYLKLNPKGVVPTLVHDGKVVIESTVINEYLDDAFPGSALKPADPYGRARMRLWTKVPDEGIHVACGTISFASAFGRQIRESHDDDALEKRLQSLPDPTRAARQRQIIEQGFDAPLVRDAVMHHEKTLANMDAALENGPWLAGEEFSLADISLTPYVERLNRLGLSPMWEPHRPRVADWFARIRARPSFDRAYTAFEPEDYDDLLKDRDEGVWPRVEALLDAA